MLPSDPSLLFLYFIVVLLYGLVRPYHNTSAGVLVVKVALCYNMCVNQLYGNGMSCQLEHISV